MTQALAATRAHPMPDLPASTGKPRADARTEVAADWSMLAVAFSDDTAGVRWYLHVPSGSVLRFQEDELGPTAFAGDPAYLYVERARAREQYRWMERFIGALEDRALAAKLCQAVSGRQAFHRFKTALGEHPGSSHDWFDFRNAQLAQHIHRWLTANDLVLIPRGPVSAEVDRLLGTTKREAERRLATASIGLEDEDLEALVALAEFLFRAMQQPPQTQDPG